MVNMVDTIINIDYNIPVWHYPTSHDTTFRKRFVASTRFIWCHVPPGMTWHYIYRRDGSEITMQKVYCKHYTHAHVQTYKHTRIDASLHHTTLQDIDIALHDGKVRYITLLSMQKKTIHQIRYVTLRSKTVHYSTYVHPTLQYIHTDIHSISFRYIAYHSVTLHCNALRYIALQIHQSHSIHAVHTLQCSPLKYVRLHGSALHCITTSSNMRTYFCTSIRLQYVTQQYITYSTAQRITLHYITLHYIALHYSTLHSVHPCIPMYISTYTTKASYCIHKQIWQTSGHIFKNFSRTYVHTLICTFIQSYLYTSIHTYHLHTLEQKWSHKWAGGGYIPGCRRGSYIHI